MFDKLLKCKTPKNGVKRTLRKGWLFRPTQRFDTQDYFLKQPVAEASISRDPLTPWVPMNGAKSDRLLEKTFIINI